MCPLHGSFPEFGCKYCSSGIKYLNLDEEITFHTLDKAEGIPIPPRVIEAPAPKPTEDPMIVLADKADEIDMAQRKLRVMLWELALVFMVASVGMTVMMLGLFFVPPLFWVGLPFAIAGVGCLPTTVAATERKYLAIHEARTEFARAQRRVGQ